MVILRDVPPGPHRPPTSHPKEAQWGPDRAAAQVGSMADPAVGAWDRPHPPALRGERRDATGLRRVESEGCACPAQQSGTLRDCESECGTNKQL